MQLLAATANSAKPSVDTVAHRVPLLLPYFRHTLASVRRSCVECVDALLQSDTPGTPLHCVCMHALLRLCSCAVQCRSDKTLTLCYAAVASCPSELLSSLLRLAFQNLLQEDNSSVRTASQQLWQHLLQYLAPPVLAQALPGPILQVFRILRVWSCKHAIVCKHPVEPLQVTS
jgi:hypothetical protein